MSAPPHRAGQEKTKRLHFLVAPPALLSNNRWVLPNLKRIARVTPTPPKFSTVPFRRPFSQREPNPQHDD
jgi:hypothetical protein